MAQVYAVMHDGKGNFMIAFKNTLGYFFHNPQGPGGAIIPLGAALNGAHDWAFPGGRLDVASPVQGALNEMLEETGLDLDARQADPLFYRGNGFYGVYFNVMDNFNELVGTAHANMDLGHQAANAVKAGTYGVGKYPELMAAYPGCPADNELSEVYAWNLRDEIHEINRLGSNPATDWYFYILANLALETYGVIVTDPDGYLAGIGDAVIVNAGPTYSVTNFTQDPYRLLPEGYYTIVTKAATYHHVQFEGNVGDTASFIGQ